MQINQVSESQAVHHQSLVALHQQLQVHNTHVFLQATCFLRDFVNSVSKITFGTYRSDTVKDLQNLMAPKSSKLKSYNQLPPVSYCVCTLNIRTLTWPK